MIERYRLLSLFDGIGCFPLAYANKVGINHKDLEYESSEIENYLLDILSTNFPKHNQLGNIEEINWNSLYLDKEKANIVTMGTPCTGFSTSGKRDGLENIESRLFVNSVESIKIIKPKYFIWENVFGVLSNNKGMDFREVLKAFKEAGYNLAWTTYNTKYFGIPQKRRRVYMIGVRNDLKQSKILEYIDPFNMINRAFSDDIFAYENMVDKFYEKNSFNLKNNKLSYFNRLRSDLFKAEGIAGTQAKRDYKSFRDVFVTNDIIRRETPRERLRFQGMPDYWFDEQYGSYGRSTLYKADGMSLPVVESVFDSLDKIDSFEFIRRVENNERYEEREKWVKTLSSDRKSSYQILGCPSNMMGSNGKKEGKVQYSGIMMTDGKETELFLTDRCSEAGHILKEGDIKSIADIYEGVVDDWYSVTDRSVDGILRRERDSNKKLPEELREAIKRVYKK